MIHTLAQDQQGDQGRQPAPPPAGRTGHRGSTLSASRLRRWMDGYAKLELHAGVGAPVGDLLIRNVSSVAEIRINWELSQSIEPSEMVCWVRLLTYSHMHTSSPNR